MTDAEQENGSRGNLSVAGLPLLDEDIEVIVHVRRILYSGACVIRYTINS